MEDDLSEGITKSRNIYLQVFVPLLIISISIIQIFLYSILMEPVATVDMEEIPGKILLVATSFLLILIMQKIVDSRRSYTLTVVGLTIWYLGEIENLMDEIYNIDYGIGFDLESLTSFGIIIAGLGILFYAGLLLQSQKDMERQQKETELYADLLRHDLANELQVLTGYLEGAMLFEDTIPPDALNLIKSADVAGKRMVRLVQAFATTQKPGFVKLVPMIEQVAADAEQSHRGLKVRIKARSDAEMLRTHGSALLPAAIENLLRNSYEHAGPDVLVTITVGKIDDNALIIISDDGEGIPPEKQSTLFSRGMTGTSKGMGLYLTRTVVRSCGGEISFIPESDGTKFRILIPIMS